MSFYFSSVAFQLKRQHKKDPINDKHEQRRCQLSYISLKMKDNGKRVELQSIKEIDRNKKGKSNNNRFSNKSFVCETGLS